MTFSRNASDLRLGRLRSDQHAVAAGFVRRLHDEFRQMLQDIFEVVFLVGEIRRHVLQNRFLIQIIFDHARHEIIHDLVVSQTGADGVSERNIARAIRVDEAGHAKHRILAEHRRVDEIIVNAPVNDMHRLQPFRRAHEHARNRARTNRGPRQSRRPSAARDTCARNTRCCRRRA